MIDSNSKDEIEKISLELLKGSKSIDIYPTPVNKIIDYANLKVSEGVDLSKINKSFLSNLKDNLKDSYLKSLRKVRGFLDRREKIIYLDLSQLPKRQNFVALHETGHDVLPWQKAIIEHLDDDETLDLYTEEAFEAEANYFASATLFQSDRFDYEMKKLNLGIEAPMYLAKRFGASNHAALRRYVERSPNRCALLVLKDVSPKGTTPNCVKRNFFQSKSFSESFGIISLPESFGYKWEFTKDYYFRKRFHQNGLISLQTSNGNVEFRYHFFNNTYNAFVLIFPKGETHKSRTKIMIGKGKIMSW